jgi:hypothetical protein
MPLARRERFLGQAATDETAFSIIKHETDFAVFQIQLPSALFGFGI